MTTPKGGTPPAPHLAQCPSELLTSFGGVLVGISITLYAGFVLGLCWVCARVVLGLCWGCGTCRQEKASCGHHLGLCCAVLCLLRRLCSMCVGGCVWCVRVCVCGVAFLLLAVRAQLPPNFWQHFPGRSLWAAVVVLGLCWGCAVLCCACCAVSALCVLGGACGVCVCAFAA